MNLDCEKGHSLAEFVQNMAEAIAWCTSRPRPWSPFATFRSPDIAPKFGRNSRKSWIQSVAEQRRRALGAGPISLQKRVYRHEGRLLAYFPDDNLACGVAEAETGGIFHDGQRAALGYVDRVSPRGTANQLSGRVGCRARWRRWSTAAFA